MRADYENLIMCRAITVRRSRRKRRAGFCSALLSADRKFSGAERARWTESVEKVSADRYKHHEFA